MEAVAQAPKLNARRAIYTIMRSRYRRNLCIPNFTPSGWWECDVFEATQTGRYREYEIKLTRADFACDARKSRYFNAARGCSYALRVHEKKHDLLKMRSDRGPTRFWYVSPAGLLQPGEIPEWSGLIELHPISGWWHWREQEAVAAPVLHRGACDPKIIKAANTCCYWRMQKLIARIDGPKAEDV